MLFPELRHFPDRRRRSEALQQALAAAPGLLAYTILLGISLTLLAGVGYVWVLEPMQLPTGVSVGLVFLFLVLGVWMGLYFLLRDHIGRELRRVLRREGIELCYHCGYDLRGRSGAICVECGRAVDDLTPSLPLAVRFLYCMGFSCSAFALLGLTPLSIYMGRFRLVHVAGLVFWGTVGTYCYQRLRRPRPRNQPLTTDH